MVCYSKQGTAKILFLTERRSDLTNFWSTSSFRAEIDQDKIMSRFSQMRIFGYFLPILWLEIKRELLYLIKLYFNCT
jgi:hypothetical protein